MQIEKTPKILRNFQFVLINLRNVKAVSNKRSPRIVNYTNVKALFVVIFYILFLFLEKLNNELQKCCC